MKKLLLMAAVIVAMTACSGNKAKSTETTEPKTETTEPVYKDAAVVDNTLPEDTEEDTEEVTETKQSGTDWDKFLDEYDSYCTKIAALSKKAMAGDMSAMTDYASLIESAEALESKLEDAESEMTPAQIARLNKIVQKIAQAAM